VVEGGVEVADVGKVAGEVADVGKVADEVAGVGAVEGVEGVVLIAVERRRQGGPERTRQPSVLLVA
jgi:hypothetical protein